MAVGLGERVQTLLQASDDYTVRQVPEDSRKGAGGLLLVGIGLFFVINTLWNGGLLGQQVNMRVVVVAALVGAFINAVIAALIAFLASREGVNLGMLVRYSFGSIGFVLPLIIVAGIIIGFISLGLGIGSIFSVTLTGFGSRLFWMLLLALLVLVSSSIGILAILGISRVAVPLVAIGILWSAGIALGDVGGLDSALALGGEEGGSTGFAISLVTAQWITGVLLYTADVYRWAPKGWTAAAIAFFAVLIGQPIFTIIGGLLVHTYEIESFPAVAEVFQFQGIALAGFFLLALSFWTTVDNSVYSSTQALGNAFLTKRLWFVVPVIIVGILGASLGLADLYFLPFLGVITALVPPIVGVIFADYFIVERRHYPTPERVLSPRLFRAPDGVRMPSLKAGALLGWAIGFIWIMWGPDFTGVTALTGILVAFVVHAVVGSLFRQPIEIDDAVTPTDRAVSSEAAE